MKMNKFYMTLEEFSDLSVNIYRDVFGDVGVKKWHPEDLQANLQVVQEVISKTLTHFICKDWKDENGTD